MAAAVFPISRYAAVLGKSPRALQLTLRGVKSNDLILVRGQQTAGYSIAQLPARTIRELDQIAEKRGYRNAEHLLGDFAGRWTPHDRSGKPVPMNEVSLAQLQDAARVREALAPTLRLELSENPGETDRRAALSHYRGEFGQVSERHLRRLVKRTIQRDAGEGRFDDPALYLQEIVTRRPEARTRTTVVRDAEERTVVDALSRVKNHAKPTFEESALLWTIGCEFIAQQVGRGAFLGVARRRLFELFSDGPVTLAKSDAGLRKSIVRKFERWNEGGQTLKAVEDRRPVASGNYGVPISEDDRLKLVGHTRINCGGRVSQGYRDLLEKGELSEGLTNRYLANPSSKSYVPPAIRGAVAPDVERLKNFHLGPREHKLRGAYHTRDWSTVAAGDWYQSDDLTPPVYFYEQSWEGQVELMRGQFLPMIDERTTMILGFVLIPRRNYNSLSIRSLITNVCSEHGLPGRGFSFERGIWKTSKIITGGPTATFAGDRAELGLRRLGMQFRHADLPRGKVIERVLGQLQDLMESLPGYCGRNEMLEKHERFQHRKRDVEAGRVEPSAYFLDALQMCDAFDSIVARYNETPQQGCKLDGISPIEGWNRLQRAEPRAQFHAASHYFLASDVKPLKIGPNGITFKIGKQTFNYKDAETGARWGDTVFAWFNPQRPELLPCTIDRGGAGLFVVERSFPLPAVDASRELLASENAKGGAHQRYAPDLYRTVKNVLPAAAFRGQTLDRKGLQLGAAIEKQQQKFSARRQSEEELETAISRKAKLAGIPSALVPRRRGQLESMDKYMAFNAQAERKAKEQEAQL
ncbi:MAG: hypothetical protein ACR2NX_14575 [Chthoniobacterales bacterium]